MSLFSERLARRITPSIVLLPALASQLQSLFFSRDGDPPVLYYNVLNHWVLFVTASSRLAHCAMCTALLRNDRGCAYWAPMGGSTVP
jgi:hypothetical protein